MFSRLAPLIALAALALASTPADVSHDVDSIGKAATTLQSALAVFVSSPNIANAGHSHVDAVALDDILQSATTNVKNVQSLNPSDVARICNQFTGLVPEVLRLLDEVDASKKYFAALHADGLLCSDITKIKGHNDAYIAELLKKTGSGCANAKQLAAQVNAKVADTVAKACAH